MDDVDRAQQGEASAFCPRCDKEYMGVSRAEALALVGEHVKRAHPDYQNWK